MRGRVLAVNKSRQRDLDISYNIDYTRKKIYNTIHMSPEAPKFREYTIIKSPQVLVFLTRPLRVPFEQIAADFTRAGVRTQYMDFVTAQRELFDMQLLLGLAEMRPAPILYYWEGKEQISAQPTDDITLHGIRMASGQDIVFKGLGGKLSSHFGSVPICAPSNEFLSSFHNSITK